MDRSPALGLGFLVSLAAAASAAQEVQVKVIEIKGSADTRPDVEKAWTPLKAGDVLGKGAWIQTGLRSRVYVKFGDNTVVQVKSATLLQISEAGRESGRMTGRLKLALGNVHVEVNKGTEVVDFKVVTPQVTTSVKGTGFDVRARYSTTRVDVQHGRVNVDNRLAARDVDPGRRVDSRLLPADVQSQLQKNIPLAHDSLLYDPKASTTTTIYQKGYTYDPSAATSFYTVQSTTFHGTFTRTADGTVTWTDGTNTTTTTSGGTTTIMEPTTTITTTTTTTTTTQTQ